MESAGTKQMQNRAEILYGTISIYIGNVNYMKLLLGLEKRKPPSSLF